MAIANRQDLIDYCLRRLGAPVIQIDVDTTQLEDRIDEAIQYYQEYHSDAIHDMYFKHQITADDVTNGYVTLPEDLTVVKRVLPLNAANTSSGMFNAQYQMALNDVYMLRGGIGGGVSQYVQTMSYISMINDMFSGLDQTRFNRNMNALYFVDYTITEGDWIVIDGSKILDPQTYTDVYNDMFLKRYATALIKRQWASNIKKFDGMQLPGGVTFNGQQLFDEANTEIEKIEEEMQLRYEEPVDFFLG